MTSNSIRDCTSTKFVKQVTLEGFLEETEGDVLNNFARDGGGGSATAAALQAGSSRDGVSCQDLWITSSPLRE